MNDGSNVLHVGSYSLSPSGNKEFYKLYKADKFSQKLLQTARACAIAQLVVLVMPACLTSVEVQCQKRHSRQQLDRLGRYSQPCRSPTR